MLWIRYYFRFQKQSEFQSHFQVIAKNRDEFSIFNIDTLRNEFILLRQLTHPGIVKFEMLSESKEEMFAVMERMDGDMLELILSQVHNKSGHSQPEFLKFVLIFFGFFLKLFPKSEKSLPTVQRPSSIRFIYSVLNFSLV